MPAQGTSAPVQGAQSDRTVQTPAPTRPESPRTTQLKRQLRSESFDEGEARLAPGAESIQRTAAEGVRGGGGALPHLDTVQAAFGHHDLSGVRAHRGDAAQHATRQIGAEAYATGQDIAFSGAPDLHTVAHEAAHVVQQKRGVALSGGVGASGDAYERHADAVADATVAGSSAQALLDEGPSGGSATQAVQGLFGFGDDDEADDDGGGSWVDKAKEKASNAWDGAKEKASNAWDGAKEKASNAWDGAKETAGGAWDGAQEAAGGVWDGAKEKASNAWDGAKEAAGGAWDGAKEKAGNAWEGAKEAAGGAKEGLESGAAAVKNLASNAWDELREAGGQAWEEVKAAGGDALRLMQKYGAKTMKELQEILKSLPSAVTNRTDGQPDGPDTRIAGTSGKFVIGGPETSMKCAWGEISIAPAAEVVYKVVSDPDAKSGWKVLFWKSDGDQPDAPSTPGATKTESTAGGQKDGNQLGVQGEVKRQFEDKVLGAKPAIKAGGEGTVELFGNKQKGKIGLGLELEWEDFLPGTAFTAGFDFNIIKWETGKPPKIGVATASAALKPVAIDWVIPSGPYKGSKVALEATGKLELDLDPNEAYVAQRLAAAAASMISSPLALIAGGILSAGLPLVQIATMDNIDEGVARAIAAGNQARRYGVDYAEALRGSHAPTQGGLDAAQWLERMKAEKGPDAVAKFVESFEPAKAYMAAAAQAWPKLRQQAIDAYWKAHPAEKFVSLGGHGPKSGGMQALERMLSQVEPTVLKY